MSTAATACRGRKCRRSPIKKNGSLVQTNRAVEGSVPKYFYSIGKKAKKGKR